jgi:hypothetical protein
MAIPKSHVLCDEALKEAAEFLSGHKAKDIIVEQ